jgi:hypothetical protein
MDDKSKVIETKIALLLSWFVPVIVLMFCFYRFALKPNVWLLIFSCIASVFLGWLFKAYLEV